jgi:glycine cleavage system aminomethyltransferase T
MEAAVVFPRPGESMREAVDRECLATRNAVGILDASTLGKIDIQGPDARSSSTASTPTPGRSWPSAAAATG